MTESAEIRTLFRMNMISTLFSSLNTKVSDGEQPIQGGQATVQPVLIVMQKTMPIFKDVATIWINENVVIEVRIDLLTIPKGSTDFCSYSPGSLHCIEVRHNKSFGRFQTDATGPVQFDHHNIPIEMRPSGRRNRQDLHHLVLQGRSMYANHATAHCRGHNVQFPVV